MRGNLPDGPEVSELVVTARRGMNIARVAVPFCFHIEPPGVRNRPVQRVLTSCVKSSLALSKQKVY